MRIETPLPEPYQVEDYDFHLTNGNVMSFVVAKDLGDSIDFDTHRPLAVELHFAEKPSLTDPDAKLPAEDVTLLMQHVILVAHRSRLVTPPTREEKDLFKQSFFRMPKSIN